MTKILYLGADKSGSTSLHRALALRRLGHDVTIKSPYKAVEKSLKSRFWGPVHYRTGYRLLQGKIKKWLTQIERTIGSQDLVWVNGGELFGADALEILKSLKVPLILYNNDDPTGGRDGRRFDSLLKSLPYYDLCVVRIEKKPEDFLELGATNVMSVKMSYDEVEHQPYSTHEEIPEQYRSDIAFIGTWMRGEGRDKFMLALVEGGLPISIWGGRWHKSPLWTDLKPYYRGGALSGKDYVAAMQGAKLCIGLLSKGNRDLHTRRSVEIPYAGGVLCAERTSVHLELFKDGEEAVFWDDVEECIQQCKELLANDARREQVRQEGMKRVRELKVGNEDICKKILDEVNKL